MSFPKYPAYKDSGVEWLGRIPSQWESLPGRRLFDNVRAPASSGSQQLAVTQSHGVIPQEAYMEMQGHRVVLALSGTDNFKAVSVNDFVISLRSFQGGLEHSCYSGCVSPAYTVLRPKSEELVASSYFRYLLKSREYVEALQAATTGIRDGKTITYDQFGSIPLPLVPMQEQLTIAGFLDSETSRIDALIAEQQRLIELLKEKRQAVISQAVTKGLDPSVPMKDSGVEWLGEVPEHWTIGSLRWFSSIQGGIAMGKKYTDADLITLPYLRAANVQSGYLDLSEIKEIDVDSSEVGRYSLKRGDVLMLEGGDNDKVGRGTVWQAEIDPCLHQNHVFSIRPNPLLAPEWLALYTQSVAARAYFFVSSKQSTNLASISSSNIMGLQVPIPPRDEQASILTELNRQTDDYDELINAAVNATSLLSERRSALISAAVTGKIDVREWQPPAPESAGELVHG